MKKKTKQTVIGLVIYLLSAVILLGVRILIAVFQASVINLNFLESFLSNELFLGIIIVLMCNVFSFLMNGGKWGKNKYKLIALMTFFLFLIVMFVSYIQMAISNEANTRISRIISEIFYWILCVIANTVFEFIK